MSNLFDFRPDHNDELDGATRRDAALALLRARRATLIRELQIAALRVVLDRGQVCADDVRALVPIPSAVSPKVVGAAFRGLATAGLLRRDGFANSKRPQAHARPLSQWQLADADAAAAWLDTHRAI